MEPRFVACFWTLAGNSHPFTSGGVSELPLEVRADAAAEAGFWGFSFIDTDLASVRKHLKYSEIRQIFESRGLGFIEIELITDWFATGERRAASDRIRGQLLEAAAELGTHHIKVVGDLAHQFPRAQMVDSFGQLCVDAEKAGTKIAIELTPLTNLTTPEQGIDLVRASGASNAGLCLDVWHMGRAGIPLESLDQIPRELIISIELDDADLEIRGTLLEDTVNHRRLCGEGQLEPARLIAAMRRAGYGGAYGIEILSDAHRALPVKDAARAAIRSARAQFDLLHQ